jgi:DNA replication protein DnaC
VEHQILESLSLLYASCVHHFGRKYLANSNTNGVLRLTTGWLISARYHSLLLMGGVGTGKTVMLTTLRRYFKSCKPDKVLGCGEVVYGVMIDSATRIAKYDEEQQRSACQAGVLLIDDFGVEPSVVKTFGTVSTPLVDVLCERYERRRPTILSTNLDMEALKERYGERLYDRLCEVYGQIAFNFKSFRQP